MSFILSNNMNLPIPAVGNQPGPQYAIDVNSALTLIDSHDHSPGKGVQITPAGININAALTFNSNSATSLASAVLVPQSSTPANGAVFSAADGTLHYIDYTTGFNTAITLVGGGVAGTPGSIAGLTSPASATYVSGSSTFVWQSNTSIAANMDFGSAIFRNLSPNSTYGVTVSAPSSLALNYSLILPALPGATSFMTLDASGNMSAPIATSGGITGSNIAAATITGANIALNTITSSNLASSVLEFNSQTFTSGDTFTVPNNVNQLFIIGTGGGGGGGAGGGGVNAGGGSGGSGGSGATPQFVTVSVTPGTNLSVIVGAAGTGGAGHTSLAGSNGTDGGHSGVSGSGVSLYFPGGAAGLGGAVGGSPATTPAVSTYAVAFSGLSAGASGSGGAGVIGGGGGAAAGGNSSFSLYVTTVATGGTGSNGGGGGAGGAGLGAGAAGGNGAGGGANGNPGGTTFNYGSGGGGGGGGSQFSGGTAGGSGSNGVAGKVIIYWLG